MDIIDRARIEAAHDYLVILHARKHYHRYVDAFPLPTLQDLGAEKAGHQLVDHGEVELSGGAQFVGFLAILRDNDLVSGDFEGCYQECCYGLDIVGDEDSFWS